MSNHMILLPGKTNTSQSWHIAVYNLSEQLAGIKTTMHSTLGNQIGWTTWKIH